MASMWSSEKESHLLHVSTSTQKLEVTKACQKLGLLCQIVSQEVNAKENLKEIISATPFI